MIELGPKINFIVGHNGSGKSAILTGIAICLGGKASQTQRGSRLSSFIKDGCDFSLVSVTLDNADEDAFEPELFGKEIIIERMIDKTTSHYKIKNEWGKTVSTKRETLDNILAHYEIIIDNPMSILTQDSARSFLTSTSTSKIYHYLSEGIQHETWKTKNAETISSNNEAKLSIKALKEKLRGLHAVKETTEKKYQARLNQENSARNLRFLKGKLAWKQVENDEAQLEEKKAKIAEYEKEAQESDELAERIIAERGNFDSEKESLEQELEVTTRNMQEIEEERAVKFAEIKQVKMKRQAGEEDQKSIQRQIAMYTSNLTQLQEALDEEQKNLDGGYHAKRTELKAQLKKSEELYTSVEEKLRSTEEHIRAKRSEKEDYQPQLEETQNAISNSNKEIEDCKKNIKQIQSANNNQLTAYGPSTARVLAEIERLQSRFREKPIGPLGRYTSLKDAKWGAVLNRQLQSTLTSFVVSNDEDKQLLFDIFTRSQAKHHSIIVTKRDMFNYKESLPDSKFTTVLDVLNIEDEHIKRIFINYNRIESTILIENRQEAESIMYPKPPRVTQCYALTNGIDGCIVGGGDRNSSGSTPIYGWDKQSLLQSKASDEIEQWNHRFKLATESRENAVAKQQQLMRKKNALGTEIEKYGKAITQYRDRIKRLRGEIHRFESELSEEVDTTRVSRLHLEIEECTEKKETHDNQYTDSIIQKQELQEQIRGLSKEMEEINARISGALEEKVKVQRKIDELQENKLRHEGRVSNARRTALIARDRAIQQTQIMQLADEAVQKSTETAVRFHEARLSTEESIEDLFREIRETQGTIQALESEHTKSLEAVTQEYQVARAQYVESKKQFEEVRQVVKKLCEMQNQHEKQYGHFLRVATVAITGEFYRILRERNFDGQLVIDHNNQKIILHAAPKSESMEQGKGLVKKEKMMEGGGDRPGRDPRTFSGGEKSFSQIAFLLAVWKAMGCKVRGLDEFDVFMDEVNRKVSMKLMIDAVKESSNVQTIFITPNNMADMNVQDEDVRIHLMADPRR